MNRIGDKSLGDLLDRVSEVGRAGFVPVTDEDRFEFAVALVLHGWGERTAFAKARAMPPNDGALQMLARARIAYCDPTQRA